MDQQIVTNLLMIYAAAVIINTASAAALYRERRDPYTRAQLTIWATTFLALLCQGALQGSVLGSLFGVGSVFMVSAAVTNLLSLVEGTRPPWRLYLGLLGAALAVSVVLERTGQPFAVVMLPTLLAVAGPMLRVAMRLLWRWSSLSTSVCGLALASTVYGLHQLDFAFLGDKPQMAPLGFTLALLTIFMLSIFVPAVVVEKITEETARSAAEMEAAHRIQTELLPQDPFIPRLELACYMQPAEEVGGDYYDIFHLGDRAWILVGDVTGHGLSSGLVMLMAQSIISSILHTQRDIGPRDLNILTNQILHKNLVRMNEDRMMTLVSICLLDPHTLVLSGWHDNVYIHRRASNTVETLTVTQFPFGLGFLESVERDEVTESTYRLDEGDTLFVITDGVTEAAEGGDYTRGLFDESRLVEFITDNADKSPDQLRDLLAARLEAFTHGVFHDDVTFIIARARPA